GAAGHFVGFSRLSCFEERSYARVDGGEGRTRGASGRTQKWRLAVLGAAVRLAAASGIAYAAIPGPDGVIHGCVNSSGQVRVIDPGAGGLCLTGESALDWNVTGGKGPTGSQGAPGVPG